MYIYTEKPFFLVYEMLLYDSSFQHRIHLFLVHNKISKYTKRDKIDKIWADCIGIEHKLIKKNENNNKI